MKVGDPHKRFRLNNIDMGLVGSIYLHLKFSKRFTDNMLIRHDNTSLLMHIKA